jgi:hypothetical protein
MSRETIAKNVFEIAVSGETTEKEAWAALLALRHFKGVGRTFIHAEWQDSWVFNRDIWEYANCCFAVSLWLIENHSKKVLNETIPMDW